LIHFVMQRDDVLRTRFAISPLHELQWAVEVVRDPSRRSIHLPFARWAEPRAARIAESIEVLNALMDPPGDWVPDFHAPPPETPLPEIEAEIERVERGDPAQAQRELERRYEIAGNEMVGAMAADPAEAIRRIVAAEREIWETLMAPVWPEVRAVLEADIIRNARTLTAGGAEALYADLHPGIVLADGVLTMPSQKKKREYTVELGGRGLLLVPVAFAWPSVYAMLDEPWQPSMLYSPRGVGELWDDEPCDDEAALDDLIGRRRAEILRALPGATHDLAERVGASPAGVSQHLGVLRRAGLAQSTRDGRRVVYERTVAGDALVR
jgi:DNA-binding transcriptional ArsR family regulator